MQAVSQQPMIQPMTQGAMTQGAMTQGGAAVQESTVQEGAMTQGAVQEGAMSQGAMSQGAMSQGAMSQGAVQGGTMSPRGAMTPGGAMTQGAMSQGAAVQAKEQTDVKIIQDFLTLLSNRPAVITNILNELKASKTSEPSLIPTPVPPLSAPGQPLGQQLQLTPNKGLTPTNQLLQPLGQQLQPLGQQLQLTPNKGLTPTNQTFTPLQPGQTLQPMQGMLGMQGMQQFQPLQPMQGMLGIQGMQGMQPMSSQEFSAKLVLTKLTIAELKAYLDRLNSVRNQAGIRGIIKPHGKTKDAYIYAVISAIKGIPLEYINAYVPDLSQVAAMLQQ